MIQAIMPPPIRMPSLLSNQAPMKAPTMPTTMLPMRPDYGRRVADGVCLRRQASVS
jgi:hypothetical protein